MLLALAALDEVRAVVVCEGDRPQAGLADGVTPPRSGLLEDKQLVLGQFKQLQAHGISVSLDDFGIGYSSLTYLHALGVDNIDLVMKRSSDQGKTWGPLRRLVDNGEGAVAEKPARRDLNRIDLLAHHGFDRIAPQRDHRAPTVACCACHIGLLFREHGGQAAGCQAASGDESPHSKGEV